MTENIAEGTEMREDRLISQKRDSPQEKGVRFKICSWAFKTIWINNQNDTFFLFFLLNRPELFWCVHRVKLYENPSNSKLFMIYKKII